MRRNPDLEALVAKRPKDRQAHEVWADWLTGEGDPLGELIAVSIAAGEAPRLARTAGARLRRYIQRELVPRFPEMKLALTDSADPDNNCIHWRWGLVRRFWMSGWDAPAASDAWRFLADPVCQLVEEISISRQPVRDLERISGLRCLRKLDLFGATNVVDLAPLAKLPRLRSLHLRGTKVTDLAPLAGTKIRVVEPPSSRG